jgi:hypothetical protein
MKPQWTVTVVNRGRNRITGRVTQKKSTTTKRKAAEREAGERASELNPVGRVEDLRFKAAAERFESEYAVHQRESTRRRFGTTFSMFGKLIGDPHLRTVAETAYHTPGTSL